jgi:hypothetical protein
MLSHTVRRMRLAENVRCDATQRHNDLAAASPGYRLRHTWCNDFMKLVIPGFRPPKSAVAGLGKPEISGSRPVMPASSELNPANAVLKRFPVEWNLDRLFRA